MSVVAHIALVVGSAHWLLGVIRLGDWSSDRSPKLPELADERAVMRATAWRDSVWAFVAGAFAVWIYAVEAWLW